MGNYINSIYYNIPVYTPPLNMHLSRVSSSRFIFKSLCDDKSLNNRCSICSYSGLDRRYLCKLCADVVHNIDNKNPIAIFNHHYSDDFVLGSNNITIVIGNWNNIEIRFYKILSNLPYNNYKYDIDYAILLVLNNLMCEIEGFELYCIQCYGSGITLYEYKNIKLRYCDKCIQSHKSFVNYLVTVNLLLNYLLVKDINNHIMRLLISIYELNYTK